GELEFFARNSGPYGSWMTYQGTRVVLDSLTGSTSYAGLIHTINGTTLNQDTDSIFIPVNSIADMKFYQPQSNPKRAVSQPDVVPVGNYQMSIFINGYDETGKVFLRTLNVGLVNVIP